MRTYNSWEEAARTSTSKMAISPPEYREIPGGHRLPLSIVKPLSGDPFWTYHSCPGARVRNMPVSGAECDNVREWKAF